jgi:O-antigen ligase
LPHKAKASYSHRLWIWRYVSHRAFERPLAGWGLDASRDKELKQSMLWHSNRFYLKGGLKTQSDNCANESIPLHPHNMPLQIWLELGVIGSILISFLIALFPILVAYSPVSRFGKALAASTYTCSLTIGFVAYGVWQNWWVSTLLISLALVSWLFKE